MKYFIIEPTSGLANRIRALDSAIAYTTEKNRKLFVLWNRNKDCNCRFRHLFEIPKEVTCLIDLNSELLTRVCRRLFKALYSSPPNLYLNNSIIHDMKKKYGSAFSSVSSMLENLPNKSSVYIETSYLFYKTLAYDQYSSFKPITDLQRRINEQNLLNKIGIHIRRTDNHQSIENSPLEGFVNAMHKEVEIDKDVSFFLATDDPKITDYLRNIFPEKITSRSLQSLDRNNPIAIQDALVDLYCLANCRKIIGSYWSSFTDVAAEINHIDKLVIRLEN